MKRHSLGRPEMFYDGPIDPQEPEREERIVYPTVSIQDAPELLSDMSAGDEIEITCKAKVTEVTHREGGTAAWQPDGCRIELALHDIGVVGRKVKEKPGKTSGEAMEEFMEKKARKSESEY